MRRSSPVFSLKALVVACGVIFLIAAVCLAPFAGACVAGTFGGRVPAPLCAAYLYASMLPAALALIDAWKMFADIGRDRSFSAENATRLKRIARYAVIDTLLYALLSVAALVFGARGGEIINYTAFIAAVIAFFGAVLTVVVRALSGLVLDAARIKDENDLTV